MRFIPSSIFYYHTVTVISQSSASNMERERAHNETGNSPSEIDIPYRWYHQIIDQAEGLCEEMEENEDV